jgi:hypothetical protein
VHFHLLVPEGVFVDDEDRLAFALHPVPHSADVLAIAYRLKRPWPDGRTEATTKAAAGRARHRRRRRWRGIGEIGRARAAATATSHT